MKRPPRSNHEPKRARRVPFSRSARGAVQIVIFEPEYLARRRGEAR